ncbi:hypothetical protein BTJ40_17360 [Microbulbifer sp. A4B17]|nr:hypothetical protein BTJ40_17360 [Microbulbifer sp. A4B17]
MKVRKSLLLFFSLILNSNDLFAQRLSVPEYVTCDRNQLTSWQGVITKLERERNGVKVWISTDHGTNEYMHLTMPNWQEVLGQFRLRSKPFQNVDWEGLFDAKGRVEHGVRAVIWLCNLEAVSPVINWLPPLE